MRVVQSGIRSILDGLYRGNNEGSKVINASTSCWRFELYLVSYFCDVQVGNDMFGVQHGTTANRPCIQCFVSPEEVCSTFFMVP